VVQKFEGLDCDALAVKADLLDLDVGEEIVNAVLNGFKILKSTFWVYLNTSCVPAQAIPIP
jgi:hypothetical protein